MKNWTEPTGQDPKLLARENPRRPKSARTSHTFKCALAGQLKPGTLDVPCWTGMSELIYSVTLLCQLYDNSTKKQKDR